jgi:4-hydroxyphenylpyruvate dioxygenase-like putative hemolysin
MRNGNRIDHVAVCVWPENLTSAVARFTELLDLEFEGPFELTEAGLRVYIDWDAGIEVVAPTNADKPWAAQRLRFLEEKGEGVYRVVFGVADLPAALRRASAAGFETMAPMDAFSTNPAWRDRFVSMDQVMVAEEVHGVRLNLGHIERR